MKHFFTLFVIVIAFSLCVHIADAQQTVTIPDENLKSAVKSALDLEDDDPITVADIAAGLKTLNVSNGGVTNITGLEYATNLTILDLSGNEIDNISVLSGLMSLKGLNLASTQTSDISALSGLTNLTQLELGSNNITGIGALSSLTNLIKLDLSDNGITNISVLSGLMSLEDLDLSDNEIGNISDLSGLTNLFYLDLRNTGITNISDLSGLTNLTTLYLGSNNITDYNPVAWLPGLVHSDIPPVFRINDVPSDVTGAFEVSIEFSKVVTRFEKDHIKFKGEASAGAEVTAFSGSGAHYTATITPTVQGELIIYVPIEIAAGDGTTVELVSLQYTVMVHLPLTIPDENLKSAVKSELSIADADSITVALMETLETLNVTNRGVTTITGLEYATNLTTLSLEANTGITDISALSGLTNLTYLDLTLTQITSISALSRLTSLTTLHLDNTQITSISALSGLTNLTYLDLSTNTGITDISALSGLTNLTTLYLDNTGITDISALSNLTSLTKLSLDGGIDLNPIAWLPNLSTSDSPKPLALRMHGVPSDVTGTFDVSIEVNEAVSDFGADDISFEGEARATVTAFEGSGTDYTATITPTVQGELRIYVPAGVAGDGTTSNIASPEYAVMVDLPPRVTGLSTIKLFGRDFFPEGEIPNVLPQDDHDFSLDISFSEDISNFEMADIMLEGDAVTSITDLNGSGRKYTIDINLAASPGDGQGDGSLIIKVPENAVQDSTGNGNTAYSSEDTSESRLIYFALFLEFKTPQGVQNGPFEVTFEFNEPVSGLTQEFIFNTLQTNTAQATITKWTGSDGDSVYIAEFTPTTDGKVASKYYSANEIPAENEHNLRSPLFLAPYEVVVDVTKPSVTLSNVPTDVQNDAFEVSIEFTENVTGFQASAISLTGDATATVTNLTGTGTDYTAEITPTTEGNLVIQVPADAAEDVATNGNTASSAHSVPVDPVHPTVTINVPSGDQSSVFNVTIAFSEDVTGFAVADISLTNNTASASVTRLTGSGGAYIAEITSTITGSVTLQVPGDAAEDAANNGNVASSSHTVSIDVTRPGVTLTGVPTTPQNRAFDVTITFAESVTGFVAADIDLSGDATATVTLTGSGSAYTATLTPTADGDLIIQVPADAAEDAATNGNVASLSHTVPIDLTHPGVTLTGVPTTPQNSAFDVTITFAESVTGFVAADIDLSGDATATVTAFSGTGSTYTATLTPTADGDLIIQVPADAAEDAATNRNVASLSHTVPIDLTHPAVTIDVPTTPQNSAFDVTITFAESVTGFVAADIDLSGDATATVTLTGSGSAYTATLTPTADGDLIIQVPADAAEDAATNRNIASQSHTVPVDLVPPTVTTIGVPTEVQNDLFDVDIEFSENVTGFASSDISLTGDATATVTLTGSGSAYTATLTPTADGDLIIQVPADAAEDTATNGNTISQSYTVQVDLMHPAATIEVPAETQFGPFEVSITFSEDVTGFASSDILLTGTATAAITDFTGTGSTYTAEITPTTEGEVIIQVPAEGAQDAAANGNLSATAPGVTIFPVWMPDANLRTVVREELGFAELAIFTQEDMLDLTLLYAEQREITKITGLEYATELTELNLNYNTVEDISPLAPLTQLTTLTLKGNLITLLTRTETEFEGISVFEELTLLTTLDLGINQIDDIAPLANLTRLAALDLRENVVEDISALEALTNLTTLTLSVNSISDISPLEALTFLTTLVITDNGIDDIRPLAALTELTHLDLTDNQISDFAPLADLENIEVLRLSGNPIADASPLIGIAPDIEADVEISTLIPDAALAEVVARTLALDVDTRLTKSAMQRLTTLHAQLNDINRLDGLEHATLLTYLDLRQNAISDVTPLEKLTALTELHLEQNRIADVTPLGGLENLEVLRLSGNPIADVSPLVRLLTKGDVDIDVTGALVEIPDTSLAAAVRETLDLEANESITGVGLQNLTTLDAQERNINDLSGLEHATQLTTLNLANNSISNISPLSRLTALTALDLSSNSISNISSLSRLTSLTALGLDDNNISSISPLSRLTVLTALDLSNNSIGNISSLSRLTALTALELDNNSISNIWMLQGLTALTALDLSGNNISNINILSNLSALTALDLSANNIKDIDILSNLTALTTLDISGNSIRNLRPLQELAALTALDLSGNDIRDIDILSKLTALTTLDVSDNEALNNIRSLQGLTKLKQLYLTANTISDVAPLAGLVNLATLRLAENPIMDTSPLYPLTQRVPPVDIDIEVSQVPPWDVNADGSVDAMDSALVTAAMGQTGDSITNPRTDVNGDNSVDNADLLLVTEHFSNPTMGAPSSEEVLALIGSTTLKSLDRSTLEAQLNILRTENDGSLKYQRAIGLLQSFLAAMHPHKTQLLANYPNPFNPETWIPYQLANSSDVQITIYDVRGTVVRHLALGHQAVGHYTTRSRAAYWDGRNAYAERVASGIYFYQLQADKVSLLRKMVILK